jgi:serine/threonine-protein kinase
MKLGESMQKRRGRGASIAGRGPQWGLLAGRLAALAAVGFGGGYLVATRVFFPLQPPPSDLVEVPVLEGLALTRVESALAEEGLELGAVEMLQHPAIDSGIVVGQGPMGVQLAAYGGRVRVTVSLGPQRQAVPDVIRLLGDRALRVLEATGFQVTVDSADSELAAGSVVAVEPGPGALLRVPAAVRVTLSRGPALVPMPYLLGIPQQEAIDSLTGLGFRLLAVDTVFRFGRDQGLVVEQDPPEDSLLTPQSMVRLSVGRRGG